MDIIVKSTSKAMVGNATFIAIGFDSIDDDNKHVDATFSITTEEADIPMLAITPYGMLIGQVLFSDISKEVVINATDGTISVSSTNTLQNLIGLEIGTELTPDEDVGGGGGEGA